MRTLLGMIAIMFMVGYLKSVQYTLPKGVYFVLVIGLLLCIVEDFVSINEKVEDNEG